MLDRWQVVEMFSSVRKHTKVGRPCAKSTPHIKENIKNDDAESVSWFQNLYTVHSRMFFPNQFSWTVDAIFDIIKYSKFYSWTKKNDTIADSIHSNTIESVELGVRPLQVVWKRIELSIKYAQCTQHFTFFYSQLLMDCFAVFYLWNEHWW